MTTTHSDSEDDREVNGITSQPSSSSSLPSSSSSAPSSSSASASIGAQYVEKAEDRIWFYMDKQQVQQGPVSSSTISDLVIDGVIDGSTYG